MNTSDVEWDIVGGVLNALLSNHLYSVDSSQFFLARSLPLLRTASSRLVFIMPVGATILCNVK